MIMRSNKGFVQPFTTCKFVDGEQLTYEYYAFDSADKADNFIMSVIEDFDVVEKVENKYLKNCWKLYSYGQYCYTIGYVPITVK